jgi:hypothetical protein
MNDSEIAKRDKARSLNTPPEVLIKLAEDEHWYIRSIVANNPNCPDWVRIMIT